MCGVRKISGVTFTLGLIALQTLHAQAPTGAIAGRVIDASEAAIPGAHVVITNKETRVVRALEAAAEGDYIAPALQAGVYGVTAEAPGFRRLLREATVEVGTTTTVELKLEVGAATATVTVNAATPQIRFDSHAVTGVMLRSQIENLPLNGRSFLELAKLEPGVQPPTRTNANRMLVPVLGAPGVIVGGTQFT